MWEVVYLLTIICLESLQKHTTFGVQKLFTLVYTYMSLRKKYKIKNKDVAKMFGYHSANSFNTSSARKRILKGVDSLISTVEKHVEKILNDKLERIKEMARSLGD